MYNSNIGTALKPIHNHIIMQFIDPTIGKFFGERTESGLFIGGDQRDSAELPRWCKVYALGHECSDELHNAHQEKEIEVLVEPLMWTTGFFFHEKKYWRTDESKILAWRFVDEK